MIGKEIKSSSGTIYKITKPIAADNRENANVYLCTDQQGTEFIAKHFYNRTPTAFIGYSVKNHYGRRRDGSWPVFNEIRGKAKYHDFLIKHIDRIRHDKRWFIILEYVKGDSMRQFIKKNHLTNPELSQLAIAALAKTIKQWHSNSFAHGDGHLDNAMVQVELGKIIVKLIDYSSIHHPDFKYCKKIGCFESYNRFKEDLENNSTKLGKGFLDDLKNLEKELKIGTSLSACFLANY